MLKFPIILINISLTFKLNFFILYIFFYNVIFVNLNFNILLFNDKNYRAGNFALKSNGDLIIEYSSDNYRLFFGLKHNGKSYFEYDSYTKEIEIYTSNNESSRFESRNIFIQVNNNKEYLFSLGRRPTIIELHDIDENKYKTKSSELILNNTICSYSFLLLGFVHNEQNEYLITYINENAKLIIQKFSFSEFNINYPIKSISILDTINFIHSITHSFIMNSFIVTFYLNKDKYFALNIYDFDLNFLNENNVIILDILSSNDVGYGTFLKCFHIKDNLGIFIYYQGYISNSLILNLGNITNDYNYIEKIKINFTEYYFQAFVVFNELIKVNDERLILITLGSNDFTNIYILMFDLYNNYNNIKMRLYTSNLNNIYTIDKELTASLYNNFLIFSSTVKYTGDTSIFSILMIFSYPNGTDLTMNISEYFMDDDINNEKNIVTRLLENITLENNIFGYEIVEKIKLITIPDEILFYNKNDMNNNLLNGYILNKDYIFKQNVNMEKTDKLYSFEYQFIVRESDYDKFNEYPINITDYSSSEFFSNIDQRSFFEPKIFYGRTNTVIFKLCHNYCGSCYKFGMTIDDQKCLSCLVDYQYDYPKISLPNCVPFEHYKDESNKINECNIDNTKFYTNITNNKKICFKKDLFCPSDYPFLIKSTNECKKLCLYNDLISKECSFSQIDQIIYNQLKTNVIKSYPKDGESLVIEAEEEYVFQMTNSLNELKTLEGIYLNGYNLSMVDLGECEKILKEENNIDENTSLIILKFEKLTNISAEKNVQFEIYNPISKIKLDLSVCQNFPIYLYIPNTLNEKTKTLYKDLKDYGYDLFNINDSFYQDICTPYKSENNTDVLLSDRKKDFYSPNETMCQANCKYSDYLFESQYLKCECNISKDNNIIDIENKDKFNAKILYETFIDVLKFSNFGVLKCYKLIFDINKISKNFGSIIIFICFMIYLLFLGVYIFKGISPLKIDSAKKFFMNKDNKICDYKSIFEKDKIIKNRKLKKPINTKIKSTKNNIIINNNFKNNKNKKIKKTKIINQLDSKSKIIRNKKKGTKTKSSLDLSNNYQFNDNKIIKNISKKEENRLDDNELNELEYLDALELDKRTFLQIYWSLLKREHIILFTFFSWNDYNISYINFSRFIFIICTDMAMNVFFFFDDSMHKIYLNYGKYDFIQQIPQIIYSTAVSKLLEVFLCYLSLTDKHIYKIKNLKGNNKEEFFRNIKCIRIKLIVFFIFTFILFMFYWYFISTFCAVYENTQNIFIKDSLSSFLTGLIDPFFLYILPAILRIIALKDVDKKSLKFVYKLSDIIPFF